MIETLKYWCQKVLPLVYDDSLSYYELLNKVALKINEMIEQVNGIPDLVTETVREQLNDGTVEDIISEILTKDFFLNVKRPPEGVTPAIGDGATNDTTAINEALAYAAEHDLAILIPEGDYVITSVLYNRLSSAGDPVNISILGCGSEASRLISANNNNIFKISGGNYIRAFEMKGVGFSGGGASTAPALALVDITAAKVNLCDVSAQDAPTCFHISSCTNLNMEDIECRNYKGRGIWLQSCNHGTVSNVRMDGSLTAGYNPVYLQASHDIQINDMMIDNTTGSEDICCTGTNSTCYGISARWSSALAQPPYYVDPNTVSGNEWHVLFKAGPWQRDIDALETEIDALPTDQDIQNLQTQIDALPTDTDVSEAIAAEAALRTAADQGLQDQIDALPISSDIDAAITALKAERLYNVKDFGAVGDGITDDTQAIQACLNYIGGQSKDGVNVMPFAVFPEGQYLITSTIVVPDGCGIQGTMPLYGIDAANGRATPGSWIYIKDSRAIPAYDYNQPGEDYPTDYCSVYIRNGGSIRGLGFYYPDQQAANVAGNTPISYRWTIMLSGSNCEVSNVFCSNPYMFLLMAWGHTKARVHRIFGCPLKEGIRDVRSADIDKITDIHFHGNFYSWNLPGTWNNSSTVQGVLAQFRYNNLYGITLMGCDWPDITDYFQHTAKYAIQLVHTADTSGTGYHGCRHARFTRVKSERVQITVYDFASSDTLEAYEASSGNRDNVFTDCVFNSLGAGVRITVGRGWRFVGCSFECYGMGCYAFGNTLLRDITFIGCDFIRNYDGESTSSIQAIRSAAESTTCIGCTFRSGSASAAYIHAIRISSPGINVTAIGNHFRNYSGKCIWTENATVTNCWFIGNSFSECSSPIETLNSGTNTGACQVGDGNTVNWLGGAGEMRFYPQTSQPPHQKSQVEVYVDSNGNLCYTATNNTKRIISYTNG